MPTMSQDDYRARVKAFQQELQPSEMNYVPSGATPPASIAAIIPSSRLVPAVCYAVAYPICSFYWGMFPPGFREFNWAAKDAFGGVVFFVIMNIIIAIAIACVTIFSFKFIARLTKLRNPRIGARFAFLSVFIVCAVLYIPLFGQSTLSQFWPSPLNWLLIAVGCLGVPYLVACTN